MYCSTEAIGGGGSPTIGPTIPYIKKCHLKTVKRVVVLFFPFFNKHKKQIALVSLYFILQLRRSGLMPLKVMASG